MGPRRTVDASVSDHVSDALGAVLVRDARDPDDFVGLGRLIEVIGI